MARTVPTGSHADEVAQGSRFEFGENWRAFLAGLDEARIEEAEKSLREMLEVPDLAGRSFLDVGSGSGLFSLAARRLGASVTSFDYDPQSVACTEELRRRYFAGTDQWRVVEASALDEGFMASLGTYDVVYAWGSLHHTGAMWRAIDLTAERVKPGGRLFIAIYNDMGWASHTWRWVKHSYNSLPPALRWIVLWPAFAWIWGPMVIIDALRGKGPLSRWRNYARNRGMSAWRDVVDWVGGYPYEVASIPALEDHLRPLGYSATKVEDVKRGRFRRGHGCNQIVFSRA